MKTGRTARWSAGDGSAGEVCRGRLRSKAKRRPKDDWSLAGQAIPTSSWRAKGHLGVGKIALLWMDGPGRLILELTGLMWWMKPASRRLVSLHTKKMKVGIQTFFFSGSCQALDGPLGHFFRALRTSPHPAPPLPDRRPFCSSAPPAHPIGQSPHPQHARGPLPAGTQPAGRFRASRIDSFIGARPSNPETEPKKKKQVTS